MARQLQLRRGTTAESTSFIGALGEVTVDTSTNQLRVHDGITPGGHIVGDHTIIVNTANLFDWKWTDHLLPDDQDAWVWADNFEWISADDYPDAYQHLVDDYSDPIINCVKGWSSLIDQSTTLGNHNYFECCYGNNKFVAISSEGYISTSTDGITWDTATQNSDFQAHQIGGLSYGNGMFLAVSYRDSYFFTSTDGVTWTTYRDLTIGDGYTGLCYGNNVFVCVNQVGGIAVFNPTTNTWTRYSNSNLTPPYDDVEREYYWTWRSICFANNKFTILSNKGHISTSINGQTWSNPEEKLRAYCSGLVFTGRQYIAWGENGEIASSLDGVNWGLKTKSTLSGHASIASMCYGDNKLLAICDSESSYSLVSIKTSTLSTLSNTETIGYSTITYYLSPDGHKIVLQDSNTWEIDSMYQSTGVAWYYILDTVNRRFKLPRTKYGVTGIHNSVGDYVEPGLPNITGDVTFYGVEAWSGGGSGAFKVNVATNTDPSHHTPGNEQVPSLNFNASRSNSIYGNSDTVQSPATQMYLYFCLKPEGTEVDPSGGTTVCDAINNQNAGLDSTPVLYNWEGTLEEYLNQDIENLHPEWICYITDDVLDTTPNPAYYVHRVGDEIIQGYKTFVNTIYAEGGIEGTASSARWADLAEMYKPDFKYPVGTLVKFGGENDITIADTECHAVISDKPGYLLDSSLEDSLPIALSGKTPVLIKGKVKKFDKLVLSDKPGVAKVQEIGSEKVIGIALESSLIEDEKLVLSVVKLTF